MPGAKVKQFLEQNHVAFHSIPHFTAYTAQEAAAAAHVRGRELAKAVIVKLDDGMVMAVLPANKKLNLELLREATGAERAILASEREFKDMFPDCEVGAMPPFGNLYGIRVYVDPELAEDDHIAFNAGTHEELIQLAFRDYQQLVQPVVTPLSYQLGVHA